MSTAPSLMAIQRHEEPTSCRKERVTDRKKLVLLRVSTKSCFFIKSNTLFLPAWG